MNTTHEQRLTKARIHLLLDQPFFGTLATRLSNVMDPTVKTTSVNGKVIRWNPNYLDKLTDRQIEAVIAHDILHVANGHTWRRGGRDKTNWDNAADKAVNGILDEARFELPDGELKPAPHEVGKAVETLYAAMPPQQPGNGGGNGGQGAAGQGNAPSQNQPDNGPNGPQGKGSGKNKGKGQKPGNGQGNGEVGNSPSQSQSTGCGAVEDAPPEEAQQLEADWKVAVAQAAEAAKSQGNLPGNLLQMIEEIVDPKVAWETLLRDFIERTARNDYNWSRPNRRYLNRGIILPSLLSEELPEIVIAVDTSGSVGQKELDAFAAEISGILGGYETTIHVIYADTRVAHHQIFTRADLPLVLEPRGGGGTDFRPAFTWVEDQDLSPACLMYLTDGYGDFPKSESDYPTLWVMTSDKEAPHGTTVQLDI